MKKKETIFPREFDILRSSLESVMKVYFERQKSTGQNI